MSTARIDYVADWYTRLRGRLYKQFKYKTKFGLWSDMIARQVTDLENAMQALLTLISIDDSIGAQLDNLGRLIGQQRAGVDDATYRLYLKARIVARRSKGTPEDIYSVMRALFGTSSPMRITTSGVGVKAFRVTVHTVLTAAQVLIAISFLRQSKESGARALLDWQPAAETAVMRWDVAGQGWDTFPMGGANQA